MYKSEKGVDKNVESVYVLSNPIPNGALQYVKDNILKDIKSSIKNTDKNLIVGEPYSMDENKYDFPVFQDNNYILTYTVI